MSFERDINNKVKDAYRRGHKDGRVSGLKTAIRLSNNIIMDTHDQILEVLINDAIKTEEQI